MNFLEKATRDVVQTLTDWGMSNVTSDPRTLVLPGALVLATEMRTARINGAIEIEFDCYIIAPDTEVPYKHLVDQLAPVINKIARAQFDAVDLPNHAAYPLPALKFTLTALTEMD